MQVYTFFTNEYGLANKNKSVRSLDQYCKKLIETIFYWMSKGRVEVYTYPALPRLSP
jgi:hypothetical protein